MNFNIAIGDLIPSGSFHYEVQEFLGRGSYGVVTQCRKTSTNETVALKILRTPQCVDVAEREEAFLTTMKKFNSDKFNIIRLNGSLSLEGQLCLEFEKLDMNLSQFVQRSHGHIVDITVIRPIMQQLATALEFLKGIKVVHADIKPSNIMVVDHLQMPVRVKVIDFGLACIHPEKKTGSKLQSGCYRSPEVMLGSPFNEAIDVWSLGCVAAKLLLGKAIFLGNDDYELMRHIVTVLGKPPGHMLKAGLYTEQFLKLNIFGLQPPSETSKSTYAGSGESSGTTGAMSDIGMILQKAPYRVSGEDTVGKVCERLCFVDLVSKMLRMDPAERITPKLILGHPFITVQHLANISGDNNKSQLLMEHMNKCQSLSYENEKNVPTLSTSSSEESSYVTANLPSNDSMESFSIWCSAREHPFLLDTVIYEEDTPEPEEECNVTGEDSQQNSSPPPLETKRETQNIQATRRLRSQDESKLWKRETDDGNNDGDDGGTCLEKAQPHRKRRKTTKVNDNKLNLQSTKNYKRILRSSKRPQPTPTEPIKTRKRTKKRKTCC